MNTDVEVYNSKYDSEEYDRPTTAPSYNSSTVIKYISPRILGLNLPNSFQGSLRNFTLANNSSSFSTAPLTTSHGLASLVQTSTFTTISSIHSINGDRAIDEHRELSKLTETLTENILQCCNLDAHNVAQELQLEWLERHANKNSITIEKMFRQEIESARQLIDDASRYKSDLERKLNDIHQTTLANDEHYQQLLSKRNTVNKEVFDYQRQLAQNRAESEFLRSRIEQFNHEIQFYNLKNASLQARQIKLRYELDEEIFAKQSLQMEHDVLENEKITNEDMHLSAIDDIRGAIDINEIATIQPSGFYREQLNHQLRRMRIEYEKKIEIYRTELHRRYELELHRYQMYKLRPVPTVTREHEHKVEENKCEKKDIEQQIGSVRGRSNELEIQIRRLEMQIVEERKYPDSITNSQRHLTMLDQIVHERERQLQDAIRTRGSLKQQIEKYREEVNRYPKYITQNSYDIQQSSTSTLQKQTFRTTLSQEIQQLSVPIPPKSILRSTLSQEAQYTTPRLPPNIIQSISSRHPPEELAITQNEEPLVEEGTLVRAADFNVERDCEDLNRIFNESKIDEVAIIRILCNRSVAQRLQIRDTYKNHFDENLIDMIDIRIDGSLKKILKLLLLSPVERDCHELRRVLKEINIDENILIEIFLNRSNKQMKTIIDNYSKLFKSTLEQDIIGDRDTYSKKIFLALLQANRPEDNEIDDDEVHRAARDLHMTSSKWKTDGSTFIRLLCTRSNAYLKQIFADYQQFSGFDIEQSIKLDTDSDLSRTLMAIVRLVRNRPRFFAYELKKSLKGSNTNEDNLNRIIISRCEIDMVQIKSEYEKISTRTLYDKIQTDTTGNYKRVFLELLRQHIEPTNKELSFKQSPESPELPQKQNGNRTSVQWKEPVNRQSFGRGISRRNVNELKQMIQFDRNNQAKSNTLLTMTPKPLRSQYIDEHRLQTVTNKRSQLDNEEEEEE